MRFAALILILCFPADAATIYCSPSGGGSGADFNNLATLPNTTGFNRGDTYKVIEGSYGSKTLSEPLSGTTTVTIEKVTAADSAVAGYSSTLHDGQAVFGTLTIGTGYWVIDGKSRTESASWTEPTGYGIRVSAIASDTINGEDGSGSTFRYLDIGGTWEVNPNDATINAYGVPIRFVYSQQNLTFQYCAVHNGKGTLFQGAGADFITWEYCHLGPGWGKEALRGGNDAPSSDWTIRYNRFWEASQTDPNDGTSGITAEIGIWDWVGDVTGIVIYGNWFYNSKSGGRNACIFVGASGNGNANGTLVYNNTFTGFPEAGVYGVVSLTGTSTESRNNMCWDTAACGIGGATTSNNVDAGADPFVNYAGFNFHLSGATSVGFTLGSPFNIGPDGVAYDVDGTWDVGAYGYDSGSTPPPDLPTTIAAPRLRGVSLTR